jgi:hypothetical protein
MSREAEIRLLKRTIDRLKWMYSGHKASSMVAKLTTELLNLEAEERASEIRSLEQQKKRLG